MHDPVLVFHASVTFKVLCRVLSVVIILCLMCSFSFCTSYKFFKKREMSDEDREMARQRMMDNVHSIRIEPKTTKNEKEKE